MRLLRSIVADEGVTAIVDTHDPVMLDIGDRILDLSDARLREP